MSVYANFGIAERYPKHLNQETEGWRQEHLP